MTFFEWSFYNAQKHERACAKIYENITYINFLPLTDISDQT